MPDPLAPGVFLADIVTAPKPIAGVPTSTAAFLGETERGPLAPRYVASVAEYRRCYGGAAAQGHLPRAVEGYFGNGGQRLLVCRVAGAQARAASLAFGRFRLDALGPGEWGNRIWAALSTSTRAGRPLGFRLRVAWWSARPATPFDPFDPRHASRQPQPDVVEDFDGLVADPESPDHFRARIDGRSVRVSLVAPERALPVRRRGRWLAGGSDGEVPGVADYAGEPAGERSRPQGLAALNDAAFDDVALVYAPHPRAAPREVARELVRRCEGKPPRFAVVDAEPGAGQSADGTAPRGWLGESGHAAFYHPWLQVIEPGGVVAVPPGGHVLGIYARSDAQRGVHKAPAGEMVSGAVGLTAAVDEAQQTALLERGVNAIRDIPGRGILVWGARTLSRDAEWKYVNVRRLALYVERSIDEGTRWAAFERSDEPLWARLREAIAQFLRGLWQSGALAGNKEDQAFFVRCDRSTMTQPEIDAGRVACEIGLAALKPAEFTLLRFGWQARAAGPAGERRVGPLAGAL